MRKSLKVIRNSSHVQFQDERNFNNLVQSDDFEVAYNAASEGQYKRIIEIIETRNKKTLKDLIDFILDKLTPFDQMGIRRLREIGRNLRIKGYARKSKYELVEEIRNVVHQLKANCERESV